MPADECFLFVREQDLVHGCLPHKQDDRLLVRYRTAHSRDLPEVLLQPLNLVGRVYHRLYAVVVVQQV